MLKDRAISEKALNFDFKRPHLLALSGAGGFDRYLNLTSKDHTFQSSQRSLVLKFDIKDRAFFLSHKICVAMAVQLDSAPHVLMLTNHKAGFSFKKLDRHFDSSV